MIKQTKSRAGCVRCKQKHTKCDESRPHCNNCQTRGFKCCYDNSLRWSTKYEKHKRPSVITPDWFAEESQRLITALIGSSTSSIEANKGHQRHEPHEPVWNDSPDDILKPLPQSSFTNKPDLPQALSCETNNNTFAADTPLDGPSVDVETRAPDRAQLDQEDAEMQNDSIAVPVAPNVEPYLDVVDRESALSSPVMADHSTMNVEDAGPTAPNDVTCLPSQQSLSFLILTDHIPKLMDHYFRTICQINSCFDSSKNPFRRNVFRLLHQSALIYHCVLSMSAAHLAHRESDMAVTAMKHQTEALSCLAGDISLLSATHEQSQRHDQLNFDSSGLINDTLLGTILLGITSVRFSLYD